MNQTIKKISLGTTMTCAAMSVCAAGATPQKKADSQPKRPNILVIFGDDIGISNISAYNNGMMGYRTRNIDRIAKNGMIFTDYYAEQSCTAGRAAFITGQSPFRTGLTKVGVPGSPVGIQKEDPTIAELLKELGYSTGQFGKNHLGDRDEFLPTNHGFDEFFGNLYHLNAEEEPEDYDYPKDPEFKKKFGPRGVIRSKAGGRIEDTGALTKKRMETIDDEFVEATTDFIKRKAKGDEPFFCWFNSARMHYPTYPKPSSIGRTGQGLYADAMMEHDDHVGILLDLLEKLKIDDNTIVIYTSDNGPHYNMWPDGAITPFRGEKNTNWEGAYRAPAMISWTGKIAAGVVSNEIVSHTDWLPTLLAAAGEPNIKEKLLNGHKAGNMTYNVHLDGYNILSHITGKSEKSGRESYVYFSDDGLPVGIRFGDWKAVFAEQRASGLDVWREPFVTLRIPYLFNLRRDPFERANTDSDNYSKWLTDHQYMLYIAQDEFGKFMSTFIKYPQRQRPASFSIDQIIEPFIKK
ncbi:MAG: arylsulfatase [Muribaculaceae bacterium]